MITSLNALSDKFITSGKCKCIHLRDLFEKSLIPDRIARKIVDILLAKETATISQEIFDSLDANTCSYLKSKNGLKNFTEFYPALFVNENEMLTLKPLLDEQILSKPNYDVDTVGSDLEIVKDLYLDIFGFRSETGFRCLGRSNSRTFKWTRNSGK